jgi:hypothetical protein
MLLEKVCTKCGGDPQPISEYYERTPGKPENICKTCIRARAIERHRLIKAGVYVNKTKVIVTAEIGEAKKCIRCTDEKDLSQYREYTKNVNGKIYTYRETKCRTCESEISQEKRDKANLFDETKFFDITDYYNGSGSMILNKEYL